MLFFCKTNIFCWAFDLLQSFSKQGFLKDSYWKNQPEMNNPWFGHLKEKIPLCTINSEGTYIWFGNNVHYVLYNRHQEFPHLCVYNARHSLAGYTKHSSCAHALKCREPAISPICILLKNSLDLNKNDLIRHQIWNSITLIFWCEIHYFPFVSINIFRIFHD
jgi:hypothetical protein